MAREKDLLYVTRACHNLKIELTNLIFDIITTLIVKLNQLFLYFAPLNHYKIRFKCYTKINIKLTFHSHIG